MIVSDKYKFVYIDPPKTASCSMDRLFTKYEGKVIPIHPQNTKHNRIIPEYAKDYTRIASIRNPYNRLISHYFFESKRGRPDTFEEYVDYHVSMLECPDDEEAPEKYRYFPLAKYLSILQPIDHLIRLENMQEDLEKIPFYRGEAPTHIQKTSHPSFEEMDISDELMEKINKWALIDCETYGYPVWKRAFS